MQLELDDVQGLVRSGYGKLRTGRFVLLRFTDPAAGRAWLRDLKVTSAADAATDYAVNIALTYAGLRQLDVDESLLSGFSLQFREGMDTPHRARLLGDEGPSAQSTWYWGQRHEHPNDMVGAILMLYAKADINALPARLGIAYRGAAEEISPLAPDTRAAWLDTTFLTTEPSADDPALLEHFGYRDGLAQPPLGLDRKTDGERPVALGEFLLGHVNEYGEVADGPILPAAADPQGHLRRSGPAGADLGANGSYLVVRQLRQDVRAFWQFAHNASGGDAAAREELAAKMVGRWRDGRPLAVDAVGLNRFGFAKDPDGLHCPFGAHIRRANPRDWIPGRSPAEATAQTRHHRLLRRGRSYGTPLHPSWDIDAIVRGAGGNTERGLAFMCLNTDLARQFEFVQSNWVMSPKFAGLESDSDPVLGPRPRTMTIRSEGGRRRLRALPRFVDVRGGAYFFLPSLKALQWLATPLHAPSSDR